MSRLLDDLNPEQRAAASHVNGPLLILAGAGSGKTRVITHRIAWLVQEVGVDPSSMLAVTFTNKAAAEMRSRVERLLGWRDASRIWISTFHSAGVRILREHGHHIGLPPNLVIYDDADQRGLVKRLLKELDLDASAFPPRMILSRIDHAKSHGRGPEDLDVGDFDLVGEKVRQVFRAYQERLRAAGAVDFGDLLAESVHLLRDHERVRALYRERLAYLMVDEFQDTNPVQYALLRLLTDERKNLAVVGDDDQSIYRWRGADVTNILSFERDFPGAEVVRLERNYRSTQTILDAAYAIIRRNVLRKEKRLWTTEAGGAPVELLRGRDEQEEAGLVAARIEAISQDLPRREIAVFYRVNAQSRAVEDALRARRIPYHVVRGRSFYDRAEIKDLTAYLRLAVNPDSDADFLRVVNTPRRGIGATTLGRLSIAARRAGLSLYGRLSLDEQIPEVAPATLRKLRAFRDLIAALHRSVETGVAAQEIVVDALRDSGYMAALEAESTEESESRIENLSEMVSAAAQRAADGKTLLDFLDEMALTGDADDRADDPDRVNLMTVHAAKGLEFDAVFIVGLEEQTFPHARAYREGGWIEDEEQMAEERRLCYVGFTRARRRLVLSFADQRWLMGQRHVRRPSRFLQEVPAELLAGALPSATPSRPRLVDSFDQRPPDEVQAPLFDRPRARPWPTDAKGDPAEPALGPEDGVVIDYSFDQRGPSDTPGIPAQGRKVLHRTFGQGVIRTVEGAGPAARLVVHFDGLGTKKILARYVEVI